MRATVTNFFFIASLNGFVLLPLHIHSLGGDDIDVGMVMGIYSAVGIVAQPLVGPWVDAIGRRPFMLLGVALTLASALLAVVFDSSIPMLGMVRALQGVAFSLFFVAAFAYVLDLVPAAERGWALGIYGVSGFVSTALAPLVGEVVIRRWGFRALAAGSGLVALVAGALVWPLRSGRRATVPATGPGWTRSALADVVQRSMAVTIFFGLGTGTIFAFLPTFAETLGVTTLAIFYTAYAVAAMAVRILGGTLIDTHGRRAVIVPAMLVQTTSTGVLAALGVLASRQSHVPVVSLLFLAGVLAGGAHGFLYPGLAALVTDRTPDSRRGAVVGTFSAVMLVGQSAGAFAFGYISHALGYPIMWSTLTALLLVGLLLSLRLPGR